MELQLDIILQLVTTIFGVAAVTWRASAALRDINERAHLQMQGVQSSFMRMTERLARIEEGLDYIRTAQAGLVMRAEHIALERRVYAIESALNK